MQYMIQYMILKTSQLCCYLPFIVLLYFTFEFIVFLAQEHFWVGVAHHFVRHVQHFSGFASHKSKLSDLFYWHRRIVYEVRKFNFQSACNSLLRQDSPRPCSFCLETVQMMGFPPQLFCENFLSEEVLLQIYYQVEDPLCSCMIHLEGKRLLSQFCGRSNEDSR